MSAVLSLYLLLIGPYASARGLVSVCTSGPEPLLPVAWMTAIGAISERFQDPANCEIADAHGMAPQLGGTLSPFWGYEFTGVDFARAVLEPIESSLKLVRIGTPESIATKDLPPAAVSAEITGLPHDSSDHGTMVAHIVAAPKPFGVAVKAQFVLAGVRPTDSNADKVFGERDVDLFSTSQGDSVPDALVNKGIPVSHSGGNSYYGDYGTALTEHEIGVTQLSPLGGLDGDSTSHPNLWIAAPGRNYSRHNGQFSVFGGTSGAQPLVAGCLANVLSVLPGINNSELRELVKRTAIPTANSKTKFGGHGTINCLQLAHIALRLREQWPQDRGRIFNDSQVYDFGQESLRHMAEGDKITELSDPCQKRKKLDHLRQAFLFQPNSRKAIADIAAIYRSSRFPGNALAYEAMLGITETFVDQLWQKHKDTDLSIDVVRLAEGLPKPAAFLSRITQSANDPLAALTAVRVGTGILSDAEVAATYYRVLPNLHQLDGNFGYSFLTDFLKRNLDHQRLVTTCIERIPFWETLPSRNPDGSIGEGQFAKSNVLAAFHNMILKGDVESPLPLLEFLLKRKSSAWRGSTVSFLTHAIKDERIRAHPRVLQHLDDEEKKALARK